MAFFQVWSYQSGQQPGEPDILLVLRRILGGDGTRSSSCCIRLRGKRHEVQEIAEPHYRFLVAANRAVVTQAVARMIGEVDYGSFLHASHFDFGVRAGIPLVAESSWAASRHGTGAVP